MNYLLCRPEHAHYPLGPCFPAWGKFEPHIPLPGAGCLEGLVIAKVFGQGHLRRGSGALLDPVPVMCQESRHCWQPWRRVSVRGPAF